VSSATTFPNVVFDKRKVYIPLQVENGSLEMLVQ
jgi:hypothetical protein